MSADVARWWERIAVFLAGVIVTLVGAYFSAGASKIDIDRAVESHRQASSGDIQVLNVKLEGISNRLVALENKMDKVSEAVRADGPEVTVKHYPTRR